MDFLSKTPDTGGQEGDVNSRIPVPTHRLEDLMDKLKLLNYEKQLLKEMKMKPPNRTYFEKSRNPGEQFFLFTSICAWLIRKLGKPFDQPQEFDDPNGLITKIIQNLKELDIPTDFPSNKLIQGAGPVCLFILDSLANQVLKVSAMKMENPEIKAEEENPLEVVENDAEVIIEKVEEEQNALFSGDDSDEETNLMNMNLTGTKKEQHQNLKNFQSENATVCENWRLEMERVLPQLKVVIKNDPRDWRAHLEQMKFLRNQIESTKTETQTELQKLGTDIGYVMEKIDSREKHLNNELSSQLRDYKDYSLELKRIQTALTETEEQKSMKEEDLKTVLEELELLKAQMEQKGTSMSDGSPLINIKKAIVKLKDEIVQMDLKIGVMDHSFTQAILRHNAQIAEMSPLTTI